VPIDSQAIEREIDSLHDVLPAIMIENISKEIGSLHFKNLEIKM
jgi:hypothetical protein